LQSANTVLKHGICGNRKSQRCRGSSRGREAGSRECLHDDAGITRDRFPAIAPIASTPRICLQMRGVPKERLWLCAGAHRVTVTQVTIECRLRNLHGLAFVTNGHFALAVSGRCGVTEHRTAAARHSERYERKRDCESGCHLYCFFVHTVCAVTGNRRIVPNQGQLQYLEKAAK
jgi:hypothetical protein